MREGRKTETFKAVTNPKPQEEDLCFSIIYTVGKQHKNVDLAAYSEGDRTAWVEGLRALLRHKGILPLAIFQGQIFSNRIRR